MLSPARGGAGESPLGIANPGVRFCSSPGYLLTPVPGCRLGFSSQLLILTPGSGLLTSASCKLAGWTCPVVTSSLLETGNDHHIAKPNPKSGPTKPATAAQLAHP